MLEIRNLSRIYKSKKGKEVTALDKINISFGNKGFVFILGKSGSGKSTLLNLLSGIDKPDIGEIIIADKSTNDFTASDFDTYRNTYVGMVFQDFSLIEDITVGDNIALSVKMQGKTVTQEQIQNALKEVQLDGFMDRKPKQLSGGEKQRVAIARALIRNPRIIFADEPTGNLDATTSKLVLDIFKELSKTRLVIVVSHDRDSALSYCDRLIELKDGKILRDVTKTHDIDLLEIKKEYHEKIDKNFTKTKLKNNYKPKFEQIKSKIPFKTAVQMSFSSFSMKKFRLLFAVLISVIIVSVCGIVYNIQQYDYHQSVLESFNRLNINSVLVSKYQELTEEELSAIEGSNYSPPRELFSKNALSTLENNGINGLYHMYEMEQSISVLTSRAQPWRKFSTRIRKFGELQAEEYNEENLKMFFGAELVAGRYPQKSPDNTEAEILISDYLADSLLFFGVTVNGKYLTTDSTREDLIGLFTDYFKVVGIFSTDYETEHTEAKLSAKTRYNLNNIYSAVLSVNGEFVKAASMIDAYFSKLPAIIKTSNDTELKVELNIRSRHYTYVDGIAATKYAHGYSEYSVFADDEWIISFSHFLDYSEKDIQNFAALTESDIEDVTLQVCYSQNATGDFYTIKVIGVFNDAEISPRMKNLTWTSLGGQGIIASEATSPSLVLISIDNKTRKQTEKTLEFLYDNHFGVYTFISEHLDGFGQLFSYIVDVFNKILLVLFIVIFLLLYNFFSSSISAKKHDIGILRSMGARGIDISKIFTLQSLVVYLIIIALSMLCTILGVIYVDWLIATNIGISLTLIVFRPFSLFLIAIVCFAIVAIASFVQLILVGRQKPIDAIKQN